MTDEKKYEKPKVGKLGNTDGELPAKELKEVSGGFFAMYGVTDCQDGSSASAACTNGGEPTGDCQTGGKADAGSGW